MAISIFTEIKCNANHDCKDYNEKDLENDIYLMSNIILDATITFKRFVEFACRTRDVMSLPQVSLSKPQKLRILTTDDF